MHVCFFALVRRVSQATDRTENLPLSQAYALKWSETRQIVKGVALWKWSLLDRGLLTLGPLRHELA